MKPAALHARTAGSHLRPPTPRCPQAAAEPGFDLTTSPLWLPVVLCTKFANNKLLLLSFLSMLVYMI